MAMNDFVRRCMQIVGGGIVQSTTDYFDNAISFVNDTKEIIDMGKQSASDGTKKFNEFIHSGPLKKARDWFYNEGGMFGDFDFDDEEFDAGFEIDSADSESGKKDSTPLSKDTMTDIAKKQTGAMYKAFGRQADLHIANTAEIVSTINTRTAELTASVNNVNNTLIQIGKRLDLIVEWTSARTKKEEEAKRESTILDYGGGISLTGVVNRFKENMEDSFLGTMLSIGKTAFGSGMITPEMVFSMVLSQTLLDKKWKKLDNKSINDIGEFLNDTVGEVIQNSLTKVLTSEKEVLQHLFEDIISRNGSNNYQSYAVNQYNEKPAVFDGMTRKSIITIIPGYLNEILKAVNGGVGKTVDNKGNLSNKQTNHFVSTVADNYFRAGMVDWKVQENMSERTGLTSEEIRNAVRALTGAWIWYLYANNRTLLKNGEIKNILASSTQEVVKEAARMMAETDNQHRSISEWITLYHGIIEKLDDYKYRTELQHAADRAHKSLVEGARGLHSDQYGYVNSGVFEAAWRRSFSDFNKDVEFHTPGAQPTQIGSTNTPKEFSTSDYVAGIFKRLNDGINVFVTGHAKRGRKQEYEKLVLTKTIQAVVNNTTPGVVPSPSSSSSSSSTIGDMIGKKRNNKYYEPAPDGIKEIYDIPEAERTPAQKKEIREWEKSYKKEHKSELKTALKGAVLNPTALIPEDSTLNKTVGEWLSGVIPDGVKETAGRVKNVILGTKTGQKIKSKIDEADQKVTDKLFGERSTNEDGTIQRSGGILQKGADRAKGFFDKSASDHLINIENALTPTAVLKHRTKKLFNEYGGDREIDPNDKNLLHMQNITNMINVAMSNGDMSTIDEQFIYKEIASIDDPDIQKQLKQSVIPLMKRNSQSQQTTTGGESSSTLGKLGKLALGGIKLFLGPVISYIKIVLFSVFQFVKGVGGSILKFTKWGVTRGLNQIRFGAKSLVFGVKGMFKTMLAPFKKTFDKVYEYINTIGDFIKEKVSDIGSKISEKFSSLTNKMSDKRKEREAAGEKSLFEKITSIPGALSSAKKGAADVLANNSPTGFMKGFTKAYRERKEYEAEKSLKKQAEPTLQAIKDSKIVELLTNIKDAIIGRGGITEQMKSDANDQKKNTKDIVHGLDDVENAVKKSDVENKSSNIINNVADNAAAGTLAGGVLGGAGGAGASEAGAAAAANETGMVNAAVETETANGVKNAVASKTDTGSSKGKSKGEGVGEGVGAGMGGLINILSGMSNIVLTIVMSLEGFKAMLSTVTKILTEALEPLNDAFHAVIKTLKPYIKGLGKIVKQIVEFIVQLVEVVCDIIQPIMKDVIQPILEVLSPLLESIINCLTPLLKLVGILLKVVLAPLMGLFKFVLLPILKIIGDAVQIIMGVLQIGFGVLMMGIGGIISGLGTLISLVGKIPLLGAAGNVGEGIMNTGRGMMSQGKEFVVEGGKSVAQGAINLVLDYASMYSMGITDNLLGRDQEEKKETKQIEATDSNVVERTYANGDIYNTYGGEYQRGMGGYLNMNQRGCGPIALADMYNRNQQGFISARSLAGSMYGRGTYDPNRGTSVGGYIDTARSMGINLTPGAVTQQSLKYASPSNPITVVGSGSDYGTRNGNNHFMNVIGTDHHGGAYVSNPLTGRIDRRPASTVAGSAVVGLYGAGDDDGDGSYTFPDAIKEAFKKLKDQAAKILGLFSMEKSDEDEVDDIISTEKNNMALEQAKRQLGDDKYAEYEKIAKDKAWEDYQTKYPKRDGQTDEEYNAEFKKYWEQHSTAYLANTSLMEAASSNNKDAWSTFATTSDKFVKDYAGDDGLFSKLEGEYATANSEISKLGKTSSSGGGSGYFTSDEGVPLWIPYSDNIEITDTDITDSAYHSPLFEFFAKTMGKNLGDIKGSGWYTHYNNPNKEGVGSVGDSHWGIDFSGPDMLGQPLYATTGGKVVLKRYQPDGGGNYLAWQDSAGKIHWYMHMAEPSEFNEGDEIQGGDLIGYAGYTGSVIPAGEGGTHLHYSINDSTTSSGSGNVINPLMYFKNYNPTAGVALGDTDEEKIYSYLTTAGMTPIGASGLMGCFKYESDMRTDNLENKFNDIFGMSDAEYTLAVDNGTESEDQFVNSRGYGTSGYGIAQFTSANLKQRLYDDTVKKGRSISSLEDQLDGIIAVLKERGIYDTINNAKTPTDANKTFLWKYEAGTNYSSDEAVIADYPWFLNSNPDGAQLRHQYAEQVYEAYKNWKPEAATHGFTDSNGNIKINSAGDEKMYKNQKMTGSTSGKGTGIVVTQSGQLRVRKDKSINSEIITHLNSGDKIDIEACGSNEWLYVPSLGGYVSSDFVKILTNDSQNNNWGVQTYSGPINSASDANLARGGSTVKMGNYNVKPNGSNNNNNKTSNTTIRPLIPWTSSDPKWDSDWYMKQTNYSEFMTSDNKKPLSGGPLYDLENMSNLLFSQNGNNQYAKNLGNKYGDDLTDVLNKMRKNGYTAKDWLALRKQYIAPTKKANKNLFPASLENLHYAMYGSGDADATLAEDEFWNNYLGWNNMYNSNISIPMSDGSDTAYTTGTYYDTDTGTTVVNNYAVTRAEDKATDARLKAVLANTYNVRSETMEALLNAILEELKKRRDPRGGGNNTNGSTKLFDERIPSQVTKLSIG